MAEVKEGAFAARAGVTQAQEIARANARSMHCEWRVYRVKESRTTVATPTAAVLRMDWVSLRMDCQDLHQGFA
jgi:hypothetical protein